MEVLGFAKLETAIVWQECAASRYGELISTVFKHWNMVTRIEARQYTKISTKKVGIISAVLLNVWINEQTARSSTVFHSCHRQACSLIEEKAIPEFYLSFILHLKALQPISSHRWHSKCDQGYQHNCLYHSAAICNPYQQFPWQTEHIQPKQGLIASS